MLAGKRAGGQPGHSRQRGRYAASVSTEVGGPRVRSCRLGAYPGSLSGRFSVPHPCRGWVRRSLSAMADPDHSFDVSRSLAAARFGFDGWMAVFNEPGLRRRSTHCARHRSTGHLSAVCHRHRLAHCSDRFARAATVEFRFWLRFFLPTLRSRRLDPGLPDPDYGLFNQLIKRRSGPTSTSTRSGASSGPILWPTTSA